MSIYIPPALNAVDFALTLHTVPSLVSPQQALSAYSVPSLSAVDFALVSYTVPTYMDVGWELLPGASPVNYALICASGAYVYTAQAATLTFARKLALDAGAYTYTGQDATLTYVAGGVDYTLECDSGAYIYTGQDAILEYQPVYAVIDTHDGGKKRRHENPFEDKSKKELRVLLERAISVGKATENTEVVVQPVEAQKTDDLSREQVRQVIADIYTNVALQKAAKEFDDEEAVLLLL